MQEQARQRDGERSGERGGRGGRDRLAATAARDGGGRRGGCRRGRGCRPGECARPPRAAGKALGTTFRLTVLGTSDTHGNVLNWDYFKDAEYTDGAANDVGLAKISTLVTAMRRGAGRGQLPHARRR